MVNLKEKPEKNILVKTVIDISIVIMVLAYRFYTQIFSSNNGFTFQLQLHHFTLYTTMPSLKTAIDYTVFFTATTYTGMCSHCGNVELGPQTAVVLQTGW